MKILLAIILMLLGCQTTKCPKGLGCNEDCFKIVLPIGSSSPAELIYDGLEMNMAMSNPDEYYRREREAMGCPEPKKVQEQPKTEASHFPMRNDYRPNASEESH